MEKAKKYIKSTSMCLLALVIYLIVLLILSYTGLLKLNTIEKINFVVMAIIALAIGVISGKKTSKKGYLEGLKHGGIIVLIMFLLNLIFYRWFNLYIFLYYLVIVSSSMIGSMIGINIKH